MSQGYALPQQGNLCGFVWSGVVTSVGLLKRKERPGYAIDGARQFVGTSLSSPESLERVSCILCLC